MHIGLWEKHDRRISKERRNIFAVNWEQVRKKKKRDDERKRVADRIGRKKETVSKKLVKESSKQDPQEKCDNNESSRIKNKHEERSRKRRNHIRRHIQGVALGSLPEWESPVLSCGCTRGACTSDSECVNRALRVQCPANCTAPLCLNKVGDFIPFLSSLPSELFLWGIFGGSFIEEGISFFFTISISYSKTETSPIILCLTSRLFIDATVRGNVSRFVRQSCKPNARLEFSLNVTVYASFRSVNGNYRAEVTIDMNGLLPVSKNCNCGTSDCRKRIVMARNEGAERNRIQVRHFYISFLNTSLILLLYRVRRTDGRLPLKAIQEIGHWLDELADDDIERAYMSVKLFILFVHSLFVYILIFRALRGRYISDLGRSEKDEKPKRDRRKENRFVNQDTNLEYIESNFRVRCVCGSLEEDGEMTQCDTCNFWLHSDSVVREFCNCQTRCTFYALVNNRSIQVRLNETVHVQRATGDDHKKVLKKLMDMSENTKKNGKDERGDDIPLANCEKLLPETFDRKDLRVFRVERLFAAPRGHRFVFGFYYARPHETFCDSQRIFHRNEVFATPLYDTLPLDAVVGRCTVLDPSTWCIGRPTVPEFKEADIYLCEYQIDRNQRSFEKIPIKNRYPINTQPYVFRKFEKPIAIKRDFTVRGLTPPKPSHKVDKDSSHAVNAGRFVRLFKDFLCFIVHCCCKLVVLIDFNKI
ncbi:unnamed protein product [Angiostrongylus costaricensis]|uniref:BAH domain-containing protein n=1 Tax=Angiostrongylus costaricensis TaxID=334426 RepID=A0A0R3PJX3_ANGCS|nr:unnamed protein product [Angiostrongylus costaricensis]